MSVFPVEAYPPQTIIFDPVQTAVKPEYPGGVPFVDIEIQLSVAGLYRPPAYVEPPHTIISDPVQTAGALDIPGGALTLDVGSQLYEVGSYCPPDLSDT